MPQSWDRIPPLRRWNTRLSWVKSGEESIVTGTPFEVHEKRYGPDVLPDNPAFIEVFVQDFMDELNDVLTARRFSHRPKDHYVQGRATAVIGPQLNTRTSARRAYNSSGRTATMHTRRSQTFRLNQFANDLRDILAHFSQLPSKPSWLVAISATIYLDEGEGDLVRQRGTTRSYAHRSPRNPSPSSEK